MTKTPENETPKKQIPVLIYEATEEWSYAKMCEEREKVIGKGKK